MSEVRVGIAGITGRMGGTLVRLALETPGIALGAASTRTDADLVVGRDAGLFTGGPESGVSISGSLEYCHNDFEVAIDFTKPEHTVELAQLCAKQKKALVIGTTAHNEQQLEAIYKAAEDIPVVMAPNMSIGINLMLAVATEMSRMLGSQAEADILELHHRGKVDAPSGTALALGKAVGKGRKQQFPECASFDAIATDKPRDSEKIQFHIMRQASAIGEHRVIFGLQGESIELKHQAHNRDIYASGAMRAAIWLSGRSPGLYSMQDVLAVLD